MKTRLRRFRRASGVTTAPPDDGAPDAAAHRVPPSWRGLVSSGPWPGAPSRHVTWLTALVVFLIQQGGSRVAAESQAGTRLPLNTYAELLLSVGPLLLLMRQRHPRLVVFGCAVNTTVYVLAGYPYGPVFLSMAVAVFAAVVEGHRHAAWAALALVWSGHLTAAYVLPDVLPEGVRVPVPGWQFELAVLAWIAAVLAGAELLRARRREWIRRRALHEAAERRRVNEERLRIARELHDVLAHSISVINVQAGVGLALLDSDPEQARSALTTIKSASKEALGEVRQVLDTLRSTGDDVPRAPVPGLGRLPELTAQAEDAGLRVTIDTEGEPAPLPPGTDLAAFRIVQEALTNVLRHSRARAAHVRLRYGTGEFRLVVDDDGPASEGGRTCERLTGGGNGLVGMRERAAAVGGSAEAGPRPDRGFRVTARLPLSGGDNVAQFRPERPQGEGHAGDAADEP